MSRRGPRRRRPAAWLALAALGLLVAGAVARVVRDPVLYPLIRYWPDPDHLVVPVEGVARGALVGSWGAARSEDRHHEGIDIFAPRGTGVVAAAPGRVTFIGWNRLGGRVVKIAGGGARIYYYAHLDSIRDGLESGRDVAAGELIATVGNTGNARSTPPHLHFGVYPLLNRLHAVDPTPLLQR